MSTGPFRRVQLLVLHADGFALHSELPFGKLEAEGHFRAGSRKEKTLCRSIRGAFCVPANGRWRWDAADACGAHHIVYL
jgi:hypothetical protein